MNGVRQALAKFNPMAPKGFSMALSWYRENIVIASNQIDPILSISPENRNAESDKAIDEIAKRISITIKYKSSYDEEFEIKWEGREGLIGK